MPKAYLGDGAYVEFDGYGLVLTTEDGMRATNTIYLEPEVYRALVAYVEGFKSPKPAVGRDGEKSEPGDG